MLVGTGLFVFGYYLGREVTRTERIREELQNSPARRMQNRVDSPVDAD
jgi:hypothetical protein